MVEQDIVRLFGVTLCSDVGDFFYVVDQVFNLEGEVVLESLRVILERYGELFYFLGIDIGWVEDRCC